jgi:DNA helicase-2/ATP-dependent DNA helicase PcrA
MTEKVETAADRDVRKCLDGHRSFALIAGAGSGKTSSLVEALARIREREGRQLRQNDQRVACITFTKRAVEVIKTRLGFDDLYLVSTLHSFLWDQIGRFQSDIREAIRLDRLPKLIAKERDKDNGGKSRDALDARAKAERYEQDLAVIDMVEHFEYRDAKGGNYQKGQLSHDDVIEIAAYPFRENATFRRITGLRFPYIFVDEAQDTFEGIVMGSISFARVRDCLSSATSAILGSKFTIRAPVPSAHRRTAKRYRRRRTFAAPKASSGYSTPFATT